MHKIFDKIFGLILEFAETQGILQDDYFTRRRGGAGYLQDGVRAQFFSRTLKLQSCYFL